MRIALLGVVYLIIASALSYLAGYWHKSLHDFPPFLMLVWPIALPMCLICNVFWWLGELGEQHSE